MSLDAPLDPTVQRVDTNLALGFIASAGGVLEKAHLISEADIQRFRESIKALHLQNSPVQVLFDENDRILALLHQAYGANGLALNLLHHTWRPYLHSWIEILSKWGLDLINKAKMHFNGTVVLTQNGFFRESRLYSQSLMDLAQIVLNFCVSIQELESAPWVPAHIFDPFEEAHSIDEDLCNHLGFAKLERSSFYKSTLDVRRRQFMIECDHFLNCLESFHADRLYNGSDSDSQQTNFLCESLRALIYQIESIKLSSSSSFLFLELRRRRLISLLHQGSETLEALTKSYLNNTGNIKVELETLDDLKARLSFEAMRSGLSAKTAEDLVDKFFSYCRHNSIHPKDLIAAEATKIHPSLNGEILARFQKFTQDLNLSHCYSKEKSKTLSGLENLEQGFQTMLRSVQSLTIASLLTGCGVKTNPHSEVLEAAPAIVFRDSPLSSETTEENDDMTLKEGKQDGSSK